jgi:hypothetical protein
MKILIEDLEVVFPYPLVFTEQLEYMTLLKRTLDSTGHALLEMPTGTGKTVCLLALLTSYLAQRPKYKKVPPPRCSVDLLHPHCGRDGEDPQGDQSFTEEAKNRGPRRP